MAVVPTSIPNVKRPSNFFDDVDWFFGSGWYSTFCRLLFQGYHFGGRLCGWHMVWSLCLLDGDSRGLYDSVLFMAFDLYDVPWQPARFRQSSMEEGFVQGVAR